MYVTFGEGLLVLYVTVTTHQTHFTMSRLPLRASLGFAKEAHTAPHLFCVNIRANSVNTGDLDIKRGNSKPNLL